MFQATLMLIRVEQSANSLTNAQSHVKKPREEQKEVALPNRQDQLTPSEATSGGD